MSMNSMAAPGLGHSLDISGTTPTPFARLVRVEVRKAYDTRSGLWLLISTAALTAVVMVIQLAVGATQEDVSLTYNSFLTSTNFSIAILLPVIGILLLTSEWSQRTAMVSFSLEPRRPHVILAKLTVGVLLAVAAPFRLIVRELSRVTGFQNWTCPVPLLAPSTLIETGPLSPILTSP